MFQGLSQLLILGINSSHPFVGILTMVIYTSTIGFMTLPYYMEMMGV